MTLLVTTVHWIVGNMSKDMIDFSFPYWIYTLLRAENETKGRVWIERLALRKIPEPVSVCCISRPNHECMDG
jgi:hypothetical protein